MDGIEVAVFDEPADDDTASIGFIVVLKFRVFKIGVESGGKHVFAGGAIADDEFANLRSGKFLKFDFLQKEQQRVGYANDFMKHLRFRGEPRNGALAGEHLDVFAKDIADKFHGDFAEDLAMGLFFFIETCIGDMAFADEFYGARIRMVEKMRKTGTAQTLVAAKDLKIAFNFGKRRSLPKGMLLLPAGHLRLPPYR